MKLVRLLKKLTEINDNAEIIPVFQDEVHFQAQTTITRVWAKKGSEPKVMSKPGKNNAAYSGFVIPETGELVVTKPEWFNFETVIQSLRDFLLAKPCPDGKKYCVILDNAPWHKKAVRLIQDESIAEYQDIRDKIIFVFLPPYSPDLNPIEQCWRITRRDITHNTYFPDFKILESTLDNYFKQYQQPNEKFSSLCSFKSYF